MKFKDCKVTTILFFISWLSAAQPSYALTSEDAKQEVSRVLNSSIVWDNIRQGEECHRTAIILSSKSVLASVDLATGLLIQYTNTSSHSVNTDSPPVLNSTACKNNAVNFLTLVGLALNSPWSNTVMEYQDRGTIGREYHFEWSKISQGIRLPSLIDLNIDADTGEVIEYSLIDDAVTISTNMNLTAADAAYDISLGENIIHPLIVDAYPLIWYHPQYPGIQTLYWEVVLRDADADPALSSTITGRIDANTGVAEFGVSSPGLNSEATSSKTKATIVWKHRTGKKWNIRNILTLKALPRISLQNRQSAKVQLTVFQMSKRR